jgi:hypothetical protein
MHPTRRHAALGPVRHITQLRISRDQTLENAALDAHETGRRFAHFHETVGVDDERYILAEPTGVDGITGIQLLEALSRRSGRYAIRRPFFALERIDAGDDVAIGEQ